jgi:hypothetical protein
MNEYTVTWIDDNWMVCRQTIQAKHVFNATVKFYEHFPLSTKVTAIQLTRKINLTGPSSIW